MTDWKAPNPPKKGEPQVVAIDPRVVSVHEPGTPCPTNPPPPLDWKYWSDPGPSGGGPFAETVHDHPETYPMGTFIQFWLNDELVSLRVEWHSVDGRTGKRGTYRGVNYMKALAPVHSGDHDWMKLARSQIGVRDFPGTRSEPRILKYLRTTGLETTDDQTSWGAAFVNRCITEAGLAGTNDARARSWLNWGTKVQEPVPGCIVVLWRENPDSWKGHVGFFDSMDAGGIKLLGGNQGGGDDWREVCLEVFPMERVLGYRIPSST